MPERFRLRFLSREWHGLALTALVSLAFGARYLASGIPHQGDAWAHTSQAEAVYVSLSHGWVPTWSFAFVGGIDGPNFATPLYYLSVAAMRIATGIGIWLATKITLVLLHVLSGIFVYLLARRVSPDRRSALVAAIVYVGAEWHTYEIIGMGRLTNSVVSLTVPLALWAVDVAMEERNTRATVVAAFALVLVPLAHVGFAIHCGYVIAAWIAVRVLAGGWGTWQRRLSVALVAATAAILANLWFLVPALQAALTLPPGRTPSPDHAVSFLSLVGLSGVRWYSGAAFGAGGEKGTQYLTLPASRFCGRIGGRGFRMAIVGGTVGIGFGQVGRCGLRPGTVRVASGLAGSGFRQGVPGVSGS